MKLRLLNLDGSLMLQPALAAMAERGTAQLVNLKPEGPALRLWAKRSAMTAFARRLHEEGPAPGKGAEITFIGSGDYHHLTAPLVARMQGPLSVVHFDNHPDWGTWPPAYHCGSWVNRVLDMVHVAKVVTIGPCAGPTWPQFKGANLKALNDARFELHPWAMAPSKLVGGRTIRWNNVGDGDWSGFVEDLAHRLPTDSVYVSIDKDVLHPDEAVTNWNQGQMRLDHILACIRALARCRRIVGLDVCGEYAPPRFDNLAKRLLARFDQPKPPAFPDLAANAGTNQRLLAGLGEMGL